MLLTDDEQDWLLALPATQHITLSDLYGAFHARYLLNDLQRYQTASTMWSRIQQPTESVESFITAMQTAANKINLQDEQQLIFCNIRGLKPHIRLHVLRNDHSSLLEL